MVTSESASPPAMRLLFDEMMSANVANALHLLDKDVDWVGRKTRSGSPRKKVKPAIRKATPDGRVARIAKAQGRFIFTSNYNMVVAAVDEGARFIWFHDGIDNTLTRYETARLMFAKWDRWGEMLGDGETQCLKVSRRYTSRTTPDRARAQAAKKDREIERRRAAKLVPKREGPGQLKLLSFDDD